VSELKAIARAARELRAAGEAFVTATVVRVRGSAYRRPGARMLATQDRWIVGSVSGGCIERDVLTKGFWRTREGRAVLVSHDEAMDERSGSGCQGEIDILVERAERPGRCDPLHFAERCLERETPGLLITVFRSTLTAVPVGSRLTLSGAEREHDFDDAEVERALASEARRALDREARQAYAVTLSTQSGGEVEALIERIAPPIHLFVFGSAHDCKPVVLLAKQLGWSVTVWDGQPRISAREQLLEADRYLTGSLESALSALECSARPAALVMGHHYEQDVAVLGALLASTEAAGARYIGVLGPRRRTDQMLDDIRQAGAIHPRMQARVYGPVGLQLGAETPAEIALAILAEAQAVMTGASAHALRAEPGAIHPAPSTSE
jgi:xanthine/CO dehydrogenase XdhC/CoxF family maturation factor